MSLKSKVQKLWVPSLQGSHDIEVELPCPPLTSFEEVFVICCCVFEGFPPTPTPRRSTLSQPGRAGGTQDERALSFCVGWTCERCISFWLSTSLKCFSTWMEKEARKLALILDSGTAGMFLKNRGSWGWKHWLQQDGLQLRSPTFSVQRTDRNDGSGGRGRFYMRVHATFISAAVHARAHVFPNISMAWFWMDYKPTKGHRTGFGTPGLQQFEIGGHWWTIKGIKKF